MSIISTRAAPSKLLAQRDLERPCERCKELSDYDPADLARYIDAQKKGGAL